MPKNADTVYERGGFWLGWDRKKNGEYRSPHLTIFFYDTAAGRVRSRTTGTSNIQAASGKLDQMYVESMGDTCPFCASCGQRIASGADYMLLDALTDYYREVGATKASADSIRARAQHLRDFLSTPARRETVCADADDQFATAFRAWSALQPVEHRNGKGVVTVTRQRSPATTEESLITLRAALNHARRKRRIEEVPYFQTKGRQTVSADNITRVDLKTIAAMLAHAATAPRAEALHSFLVATVCTLGRPEALYDLSVRPERAQWHPGDHLLRQNPLNRPQTRKRRPIVAIPEPLLALLEKSASDPHANGWVIHWRGEKVRDVDSSWATMLRALKLPEQREYRSYVLRRSMATILRNWHQEKGRTMVSMSDLSGQMGHRERTQTEVYALASSSYSDTVQTALREVVMEIESIAPGCFHRKPTGT